MSDLRYEEVGFVPHEALRREVESGDPERISKALCSASRYEDDWRWVQDQCISFLKSEHASVRWTAATCLGDLAMYRRPIDAMKVHEALLDAVNDPVVASPAQFSIELVKQFALRIS